MMVVFFHEQAHRRSCNDFLLRVVGWSRSIVGASTRRLYYPQSEAVHGPARPDGWRSTRQSACQQTTVALEVWINAADRGE
jgi:hypothetical protein